MTVQHPNPNTPQKAEQARVQRDEEPAPGTVRVQVGDTPVAHGGEVYEPGSTFIASERSVDNALNRGLLDIAPVGRKAKR